MDVKVDDVNVSAFIQYSTALTDRYLTSANLEPNLMKEIQRWMTAHLIASTIDRQAIMEKAGPAEQEFSDIFDEGFKSTTYGQMAISLDPTGILSDISDDDQSIVIKAVKE
jgi:hypothetical protein